MKRRKNKKGWTKKLFPLYGIAETDGKGLWTNLKRQVKIVGITVSHVDTEDLNFMCFEAHFNKKTWNTHHHGLIYTDRRWIKEFRRIMRDKFALSVDCVEDIDYTEQGAQGEGYVSLCIGKNSKKELLLAFLQEGIISIDIKNYLKYNR